MSLLKRRHDTSDRAVTAVFSKDGVRPAMPRPRVGTRPPNTFRRQAGHNVLGEDGSAGTQIRVVEMKGTRVDAVDLVIQLDESDLEEQDTVEMESPVALRVEQP